MGLSTKATLFWLGFFLVLGAIATLIYSYVYVDVSAPGNQIRLLKPVSAADHAIGSSSAPVVIVEYADFQCPSCQSYAPLLDQLVKEEPQKVYLVYRHLPLPQHPNALPAAYAAEAAALQDKFWEMHDLLYTNHTEWETLSNPNEVFLKYAQLLKLDTTRFTSDMDSTPVKDRVAQDRADATVNKLSYTPTLFVNGVRVDNPRSYAALKQLVEDTISSSTSASVNQ